MAWLHICALRYVNNTIKAPNLALWKIKVGDKTLFDKVLCLIFVSLPFVTTSGLEASHGGPRRTPVYQPLSQQIKHALLWVLYVLLVTGDCPFMNPYVIIWIDEQRIRAFSE